MRRARAVGFAAATLCASPLAALHAQSDWGVSLGAGFAQEIVQSQVDTSQERLSGLLGGGEAIVTRHRFALRLRYAQGRVTSDTAERDVVEGEVLLGYHALPWLTVWIGPHARTFLSPDMSTSDRRWLLWSGRVTASGALFPGRLESFVELWSDFAGQLSRPEADASGVGMEAGLTVRFPTRPFWGRLTYRIEQGRVEAGRRDTVETFALTVAYDLVR